MYVFPSLPNHRKDYKRTELNRTISLIRTYLIKVRRSLEASPDFSLTIHIFGGSPDFVVSVDDSYSGQFTVLSKVRQFHLKNKKKN